MATSGDKKYGLFITKSAKKEKANLINVFGDDEEEEESPNPGKINSKYGTTSGTKFILKKQTQLDIDKALAEDPSVFDYDCVYNDIMGKNDEGKKKKKQIDRKPKYISQLLKASEKRQKEDERRNERKIQKEREEEGDEFADKEVFITSAYKKKMQERQEEEEMEKREAALEAKLDVTNQKDMSGFYRYILDETTKDKTKTGSDKERGSNSKQPASQDETKTIRVCTEQGRKTNQVNINQDPGGRKPAADTTASRPEETLKSIGQETSGLDQDRDMTPSESNENETEKQNNKHKKRREDLDCTSEAESDSFKKNKRTNNYVSVDAASEEKMRKKIDDEVTYEAIKTYEKYNEVLKNEKDNVNGKKSEKMESSKPKWAKHTTEEDLIEARIRYFARKLARGRQRPIAPSMNS